MKGSPVRKLHIIWLTYEYHNDRQSQTYNMLVMSAKIIGSGLATISIAGTGVGIGVIFGAFLLAAS